VRNQSRKIEIYLKDGFLVDVIKARDVETVLRALEGRTKPSEVKFEMGGKLLEGEYLEVFSFVIVPLDERRQQFFNEGQILLLYKGVNLF
jgi:hypothetical protein